MKTRNEIYQGEGAKLLRFITTYHTLRYDQVLQLFSRHEQSIKSLITSLIKQGRIIYDKEHDLLCDSQQSAENPDYAIITCFWVLLDFKKGVVYHTSGEFPIKLNFFSQDEQYEIIYIGEEQEALINHVMESIPSHGSKRLIVLESESQAAKITIDDVAAVTFSMGEDIRFAPMKDLTPIPPNDVYQNLMAFDLVCTTEAYSQVYNLPMTSGRWLEPSSEGGSLEVVINKEAKNYFNDSPYAAGNVKSTLSLTPFNIVGVVNLSLIHI